MEGELKTCSVFLDDSIVHEYLKNNKQSDSGDRNQLKRKCVVFMDKDSIIDSERLKSVRAQSTPVERHSIIKDRRYSDRRSPSMACTPEPKLASELRRAFDERNLFTAKTKSKFMSALNELERANEEESRKKYKNRIIEEVLTSEAVYISQLETIFTYFEAPLLQRNLWSRAKIEMVFGNLRNIYRLNKELSAMLNEDKERVGKAFLKIAPFFKLYSTYAYEFKNILRVIEENKEDFNSFCDFIRSQESRPEVKTKLSSLLITPIQRIPRYCLLLKQILDYSREDEADYKDIKDSLEEVEKSAKHIDALVEQRGNSIRLIQIQNALTNSFPLIIRPGRHLIHDGPVLKIDSTNVASVYMILMSDIMVFCKMKRKIWKPNSLKCQLIYPLHLCKIVEKQLSRNVHISCEDDSIVIYIEKPQEYHKWLGLLKEARDNAVRNRVSLRKDNSMRKPANYKDLKMYDEVDISPGVSQKRRLSQEKHSRTNLFHNHEESMESPLKKFHGNEAKDSLFPLRSRVHGRVSINRQAPLQVTERYEDNLEPAENVYVFGNPKNENRGFNFNIMNIFNSIGNSIKRFFRRQ